MKVILFVANVRC